MQFQNWFIKDGQLLSETSKCADLLNRDQNITDFSEKIDKIHWFTIWGFVWNFWVGKSTLINNVKEYRIANKKNEKRIEFDAWKYPDRKNLWEWFVLDFAKQVDDKIFEKIKKEIDWEQNKDKETLVKTFWSALWTILPWWNIVSNLSHFFKSSPARRVFEIQDIFINLIEKIGEQRVVIVIEDVDRSWDAGIYFLETLKQFISNNNFWKNILVIVPMWTNEYYDNIDSYLKPIDYFDFFEPKKPNLENFIKNVFIDEIIKNERLFWPLKDFLEWLFEYYTKDINFRKLKLILRKANQNHILMYWKYNESFELDWRLNIMFEVAKYIEHNEEKESLFNTCKNKWINSGSLIWSYIYNLIWLTKWNQNRYYSSRWNTLFEERYNESLKKHVPELITSRIPIKFWPGVTDKEIIWWRFEIWVDLKHFVIPEKYLEY